MGCASSSPSQSKVYVVDNEKANLIEQENTSSSPDTRANTAPLDFGNNVDNTIEKLESKVKHHTSTLVVQQAEIAQSYTDVVAENTNESAGLQFDNKDVPDDESQNIVAKAQHSATYKSHEIMDAVADVQSTIDDAAGEFSIQDDVVQIRNTIADEVGKNYIEEPQNMEGNDFIDAFGAVPEIIQVQTNNTIEDTTTEMDALATMLDAEVNSAAEVYTAETTYASQANEEIVAEIAAVLETEVSDSVNEIQAIQSNLVDDIETSADAMEAQTNAAMDDAGTMLEAEVNADVNEVKDSQSAVYDVAVVAQATDATTEADMQIKGQEQEFNSNTEENDEQIKHELDDLYNTGASIINSIAGNLDESLDAVSVHESGYEPPMDESTNDVQPPLEDDLKVEDQEDF